MKTTRLLPMVSLLACAAASCAPLDILGVESVVTEEESTSGESELVDDRIEDKNPRYDPDLTVVEDYDGCQVTLNKSGSVTRLDIADFEEADLALKGRLFRGRAEAIEAVRPHREAQLIPSLEVVNGMMKPFNDGLYAAVELAVQQGAAEGDEGKRDLLADLLARLLEALESADGAARPYLEDSAVFVAGGLIAGGLEPEAPEAILSRAEAAVAEFDADGVLSRPIGFYTWSDELEGIFRQDRFLQSYQGEQDPYSARQVGLFSAVAAVLQQDPDLEARYLRVLSVFAGMTNPYFNHPVSRLFPYVSGLEDLADVAGITAQLLADHPPAEGAPSCSPRLALFPSSDSPENELFRELYCSSAPAEGTSLIDVLIGAIRDGTVDLAPEEGSGWYDYQLHSLETLLLPERGPESDHLLLTAAYKEKLVETFKSLITQARETHVKQLDVGMMGTSAPRVFDLYPRFDAEPFPTYYLRSARAYRFVGTVIAATAGEEVLASRARLTEEGPSDEALGEELRRMTETLYGLYFLTARGVGLRPELLPEEMAEYDEAECVAAAREWLAGWTTDESVTTDPRVILPVGRDGERGTVRYWAVVGVRVVRSNASFVEGYLPEVLDTGGCEQQQTRGQDYYLLVEQMVEVDIAASTPPPTRDELRALCDAHETVEEIVAALEEL